MMTSSDNSIPLAFHVMTKPRGPICNLDCHYCYYLAKEQLYPDSAFQMSDELLENYVRQYIEGQQGQQVTFAWQGGEPTLMPLSFFEKAVALQEKYRRPGMKIQNSLQTNGVLLDEEWCRFFKAHDFLIGLSLDGPQPLHDAYRVDKGGQPTFKRVMKGLGLLQEHDVAFNILTTVHAANAGQPLAVYHFLRDEVGARYLQFIPIVERVPPAIGPNGSLVSPRSVQPEAYGAFLSAIFDEWVRHDVGRVFVQIFDVALNAWLGLPSGLCVFDETCGNALAMEHNGDLYACDHFVETDYFLGNIGETPMVELVGSEAQRRFGRDKRDTLPDYCRKCDVRFVCNGGCPKNRFSRTPTGAPGLNYLCAGYKAFFTHIDEPLRFMAAQLRANRPPANVMAYMARQDATALEAAFAGARRNDPCPCGSGRKFKQCHGRPGVLT